MICNFADHADELEHENLGASNISEDSSDMHQDHFTFALRQKTAIEASKEIKNGGKLFTQRRIRSASGIVLLWNFLVSHIAIYGRSKFSAGIMSFS